MSSIGPLSPGTAVSQAGSGAAPWADPNNIKVSDSNYATALMSINYNNCKDYLVKLIVGGVVVGDDKKLSGDWPEAEAYYDYGGIVEKFGVELTPAIVNSPDFGLAFQGYRVTGVRTTEILKATNFNPGIPAYSEIDGILFQVQKKYTPDGTVWYARVNHVQLTVFYHKLQSPNLTSKKNHNGYLAFVQQFIRHRLNGTPPWSEPTGVNTL